MKMKMMMESQRVLVLVLVLVLNGVLSVSTVAHHQDTRITGCSDTDAEDMFGLDGEEVSYVDFIQKKAFEPQPDFIDHMTYPGYYELALGQRQICRQNLQIVRTFYKDTPLTQVAPSTPIIYIRDHIELHVKNTLICHVTGFYPAPVKVHWTHNGLNCTDGTSLNVPYPTTEETFTQISRLDFTPKQGDIYGCTVHHPALSDPLTQMWNVDVPQPSVGPAVFCGVGLTVGLLGVATGTFFLIKGNEC